MDEKIQLALELLTRTQGNPIWFREKKRKQNREGSASIVYETFTQRLMWEKRHAGSYGGTVRNSGVAALSP